MISRLKGRGNAFTPDLPDFRRKIQNYSNQQKPFGNGAHTKRVFLILNIEKFEIDFMTNPYVSTMCEIKYHITKRNSNRYICKKEDEER